MLLLQAAATEPVLHSQSIANSFAPASSFLLELLQIAYRPALSEACCSAELGGSITSIRLWSRSKISTTFLPLLSWCVSVMASGNSLALARVRIMAVILGTSVLERHMWSFT